MSRNVFKDTDYVTQLDTETRKWLWKAMTAINGSLYLGTLAEIAEPEVERAVFKKLAQARYSRRKDIMNKATRYDLNPATGVEIGDLYSEGVLNMSAIENAIINALDADVAAHSFTPYGGNAQVAIGDRVAIAIEGHSLQNKLAVVVDTRRNEFLVEADTAKGKVQAYFKSNELLKI